MKAAIGNRNRGFLALVLYMNMWQMVLLCIHEHHSNNDAIEHANGRHGGGSLYLKSVEMLAIRTTLIERLERLPEP
jgi:hypothetical protein